MWNSSKPIYDINNLKCLESLLFLKLTNDIIRVLGSHLTCRFYMVQCKLFVQIASCLPCSPNFNEFKASPLHKFHNYNVDGNNQLTAEAIAVAHAEKVISHTPHLRKHKEKGMSNKIILFLFFKVYIDNQIIIGANEIN